MSTLVVPPPIVPPGDPFARRALPPGDVHVWHASLDDGPGDPAVLSGEERARAERMLGRARERFVRSREIVRRLLAAYLGGDPASLAIEVAREGKPRLVPSAVRFNLAHAGGTWVGAFAADRDVGVDVERLDRGVDFDRVASRIFAPREVETIRRLGGPAKTAAFFRCWTAREAIVKGRGEGMFTLASRFEVDADPERPLSVRGIGDDAFAWWVAPVPVRAGCVAVIAAPAAPETVAAFTIGPRAGDRP
jgi:4'-phosphopantetheinyl transferase